MFREKLVLKITRNGYAVVEQAARMSTCLIQKVDREELVKQGAMCFSIPADATLLAKESGTASYDKNSSCSEPERELSRESILPGSGRQDQSILKAFGGRNVK